MIKVTEFKKHKKVRWFYQVDEYSKPTDEIVYICSENINDRVLIGRMNEHNILIEGGYVMSDELYEL